ncbi:hypothetical protein C0991_006716 [Blastosporella zonata]|nr:hypothetical protein C0991_006716 [Blastosporella zonata]
MVQSMQNSQDCGVSVQRRFFKREWKRNKPGLAPLSKKPPRPTWSDNTIDRKDTFTGPDTPQPLPRLRHSVSTGVDRRAPMHLIKTISTKSLRSAHIVIDFKAFHESYDATIKPAVDTSSLKSAPQTPKTLRRRKRLSLYRTSTPHPESIASSVDAPTVVSMPKSVSVSVEDSFFSVANARQEAPSLSQASTPVRLGHPSRPLYTAIRPNMPRPSSSSVTPSPPAPPQKPRSSRPLSLPVLSRAPPPPPGIMSVLSTTSALEEEDGPEPGSAFESFASRRRSACTHDRDRVATRVPAFGSISRRHGGGFSLSGETELRMALASGGGGGDQEDVFKFKDMGKKRGVMKKMRQLKEGLKGLVMRSHDH